MDLQIPVWFDLQANLLPKSDRCDASNTTLRCEPNMLLDLILIKQLLESPFPGGNDNPTRIPGLQFPHFVADVTI